MDSKYFFKLICFVTLITTVFFACAKEEETTSTTTSDNASTSSLALPFDFETSPTASDFYDFDGGQLTIADNPNSSGINTSSKVAKMLKGCGDSVQQWGGSYATLASAIDFSSKKSFTMDVYVPAVGTKVLLKVENAGDNTINKEVTVDSTVANSWETLTFDFSSIDNQSYQKMIVIFDNVAGKEGDCGGATYTYYFDNVKQVVNSDEPTSAPSAPTDNNTISVFSDAYTDISADFNPNWGQTTVYSTDNISNNNVIKLSNLNYQGFQFDNDTDVSSKNTLRLNYWTRDNKSLKIWVISIEPTVDNNSYDLVTTPNSWQTLDIPLTTFSDVDLTEVRQMKFEGSGTIFLDNIYFLTAEPSDAPSAPTDNNTISVFSDAYSDISLNYNPGWGQNTVYATDNISNNNVIKLSNLNYQGFAFDAATDVSSKNNLRLDYWTAGANPFKIWVISLEPTVDTNSYDLVTTPGSWQTLTIPMSTFSDVDLSEVEQMKFVGTGTIYLDNIYFY